MGKPSKSKPKTKPNFAAKFVWCKVFDRERTIKQLVFEKNNLMNLLDVAETKTNLPNHIQQIVADYQIMMKEKCPVCFTTFNRDNGLGGENNDPIVFKKCGHVICRSCFSSLKYQMERQSKDRFPCPLCREEILASEIARHYFTN